MCVVLLPAASGSEGFVRLGKSEECLPAAKLHLSCCHTPHMCAK